MKKIISFIVSFVLVFSLCSTMAFASSSAGVVLSFLKDVVLSEVLDFASPSTRREWIEICPNRLERAARPVSLHAEGVD